MKTTGSFSQVTAIISGVLCEYEHANASIQFLTESMVRVRLSFEDLQPERNYVFQQTQWNDATDALFQDREKLSPVEFNITETDEQLALSTAAITVQVQKETWHLTLLNSEGQFAHEDLDTRAAFIDNNLRLNHCFKRSDADLWYGLGEKTGPLNRTGRRFRMESTDAVGYAPESADPLYKHIPFLIHAQTNDCFTGMYYNNAWPSDFDIGCTRSGYWGEFASSRFDGGELDITFIVANDLPSVVKSYTKLTGTPPLMPRYSMGYLGSTMFYTELPERADLAVQGFIDKCQREEIPVSGFHLSSGYTTGDDGKRYAFQWNAKRFPSPNGFVASFNEQGLYLSPNIKPGILNTHPEFDALENEGAFITKAESTETHLEQFWGGTAALVDFTTEAGRNSWKKRLQSSLIEKGITSIWNDNNEFEFADTSAVAKGDGHAESVNAVRPILSNLMAKVAFDAVRETYPNTRPFVLSRGGFSGLQQWAHTWSGDNGSSWEYLQSNITTMLGMSLSGVPFNGMDIGGFTGPAPDPELFLRWIQNGIFHPRFCIHSANDDNTVTEPWMHESIKQDVVHALQTRYKLLPYLYQLAYNAHKHCAPITAPLVYDFWEDEACRQENHDFMLGDALFIPSVVKAGMSSKAQYFPANERFIHLETGERITGGQTITIDTPLNALTWYLRSGKWLVLSDEPTETQLRFITTLETSKFDFYWDDGISYDFEKGEYSLLSFNLAPKDSAFELSWEVSGLAQLSEGATTFQLFTEHGCPMSITLNGTELKQWLYDDEWEHATSGFWFDPEQHCLHVRLPETALQQSGSVIMNFTNRIAVSI